MNEKFKKQIEIFAKDETSGSIELAAQALGIMWKFYHNSTPEIIRRDLKSLALALINAQPSMAAVINMVNRAAILAERSETLVRIETLEEALQQIETSFSRDIEQAVSLAAFHLRRYKKIATYSRSRLVEETLIEMLDSGYNPEIFLSESRPGLEGLKLAENLMEVGFSPTICVDACLPELLKQANCLIIGADAVTRDKFCNKIGTGMLCCAAKEAGIPVFVIISRDKYLGEELKSYFHIKEYPSHGVFDKRYQGATIFNTLFEWNSNDLVTSFIGQDIFDPDFPGGILTEPRVAKVLKGSEIDI